MTENHRMVGFLLYRSDIDAPDANAAAVTDVIDMSRSVNGRDNTIMLAAVRTAGAGILAAELYAILPSDQEGGELPFPVFIGSVDQAGATGFATFKDLPAAKYKLLVTGVGTGTWDLHVAYSGNLKAVSG